MLKKNILQPFAQDFTRILPLLTPQLRWRSAWIFFIMVVQSLLELFFIISLTDMGLAIATPDVVRTSPLYSSLFNLSPSLNTFAADPKQLLLVTGAVVVLVSILKSIASFLTARSVAYLGEDISLSIGQEIMSRYLYQDYAWHLSPASASMFQRMTWREQLGNMLTQILTVYSTVLTILILFLSLMGTEPALTTIVVVTTSVIGFLLFQGIRSKVDYNASLSAESSKAETSAILCVTKGIREVLIYRQQKTFLQALVSAALKGRCPRTFTSIAPTLPTWVLEAVGFAVVVIAVSFLIYIEKADMGRISTALSILVLTAWRVLPYCNRVVSLQINIRSLRPMAYAVIELLEELRKLPNKTQAEIADDFSFNDNITLKNIDFKYFGTTHNSLTNINLTLNKGEKVGIIGPSGSGKTTLAGVLTGLLPHSNGSINVDGIELTENRRIALTKQIGYVPQSPFLFSATLAENIAFRDWGKKWDEEKVLLACKQASIDFIENNEKGILRTIGENGAGLSGGQAQRVSIARAMYTQPSLLIFDEATSALDQHNEKVIQETIENLAEKVTCLIIAHRLSTVEKCDRVIWIDDGKIVLDGKAEAVIQQYTKFKM